MENNPHLIDRYIVSKVKGSTYLVTNGDNSFSISGKAVADTLCDTLNTKVDSIVEAMCNLTGDWAGYAQTITSVEQLVPFVGKKIAIQEDHRSSEYYSMVLDKDDIKQLKKEISDDKDDNEFVDTYLNCKVIHLSDIYKRLGLPEDTVVYE